jgi:EAL domain-containing protein (putative c-di-GMP-specific phosphodiesterase class I)
VAASEVTSFEALLRWHHPERGLIGPSEFIPIAEKTGSIVPVGEWALQQACKDAATWPEAVKVSVNLSSVQVEGSHLVAATEQALQLSGLPASRLELEVTESVLLSDCAHTRETLLRLQQLGVHIAIDDFGTAFASLKYLHTFPFNKIKIDRSFVSNVDRKDCIAIVQAVTQLAATLNMATVAEGIETRAQYTSVTDAGCNEAQGFYFSRPVPSSKVAEVLALCKLKGLVKSAHGPAPQARKRALRGS